MSENIHLGAGAGAPVMEPPAGGAQGGVTAAAGTTEPKQLPDQQLSAVTEGEAGGPRLQPPGQHAAAVAEAAGAVTATWQTSTVAGLWSINEVRNAWVNAAGAWRKIYNGRDGAFAALVALAAHARQTGRSINFRQEADGMIYEIYLW